MENYLGEIRMFAGSYAPQDWAFCNGQLLSIADNNALYALFGTTYGGNGVTTFGLPDLRGRLPVHYGTGTGLSNWPMGGANGSESVTLTSANLPPHNHNWNANSAAASLMTPANNVLADVGAGNSLYETQATFDKPINAPDATISKEGGSQSHENMMPYLAISFIVALQGIFPTQN